MGQYISEFGNPNPSTMSLTVYGFFWGKRRIVFGCYIDLSGWWFLGLNTEYLSSSWFICFFIFSLLVLCDYFLWFV